jgi:septal ring factor EnvC (AmiA/AmiB activator)
MPASKSEWAKITEFITRIEYLEKEINNLHKEINKTNAKIEELKKEKLNNQRYRLAMFLGIFSLLITIILKVLEFLV